MWGCVCVFVQVQMYVNVRFCIYMYVVGIYLNYTCMSGSITYDVMSSGYPQCCNVRIPYDVMLVVPL